MVLLLPLLEPLLEALAVIAVLALIVYIVTGLVALIEQLPGIGSLASWFSAHVIHAGEHALSHWLGTALRKASGGATLDAAVGSSFHRLAGAVHGVTDMARELRSFALATASTIAGLASAETFRHVIHELRVGVARALHEVHTTERRAVAETRATVASIAHGVYPRLRTLEHEAEHVLPREVANLRKEVRALEDGAINTFKWLASHPWAAATTAFAAAVAVALRTLGLGWTRCDNNGSVGKVVCGLESSLLQDMLGALFGAVAILDFRELVKLAQTVEHDVAVGVKDLLNV